MLLDVAEILPAVEHGQIAPGLARLLAELLGRNIVDRDRARGRVDHHAVIGTGRIHRHQPAEHVVADRVGLAVQPFEGQERLTPVLTAQHEIIPDSGGPGKHRGGCGVRKGGTLTQVEAAVMSYCCDRARSVTWGIGGGLPSLPHGVWLNRGSDEERFLGANFSGVPVKEGDRFERPSAGGGGLGDPLDRDPDAVLEDVGLINREQDAFKNNRTLYRIGEPLVTFYHGVMRPIWSDLEFGRSTELLWERSGQRFTGNVLGPHLEQVCRHWTRHLAAEDLLPDRPSWVGHGTVNDPVGKTSHEVDVVAYGYGEGGGRQRAEA